jgi:hypothetical protein
VRIIKDIRRNKHTWARDACLEPQMLLLLLLVLVLAPPVLLALVVDSLLWQLVWC